MRCFSFVITTRMMYMKVDINIYKHKIIWQATCFTIVLYVHTHTHTHTHAQTHTHTRLSVCVSCPYCGSCTRMALAEKYEHRFLFDPILYHTHTHTHTDRQIKVILICVTVLKIIQNQRLPE